MSQRKNAGKSDGGVVLRQPAPGGIVRRDGVALLVLVPVIEARVELRFVGEVIIETRAVQPFRNVDAFLENVVIGALGDGQVLRGGIVRQRQQVEVVLHRRKDATGGNDARRGTALP